MKMEEDSSSKDDRLLMDLLKKVDLEEPSVHLVDKIITTYSSQSKQARFRKARLPLILLTVLSTLLFLPMLITRWKEMSISNPTLRMIDTIQGITFEISFWYLVCPLLLLLSLILIIQIEIRTITFQRPKNPIT